MLRPRTANKRTHSSNSASPAEAGASSSQIQPRGSGAAVAGTMAADNNPPITAGRVTIAAVAGQGSDMELPSAWLIRQYQTDPIAFAKRLLRAAAKNSSSAPANNSSTWCVTTPVRKSFAD